MITKSSVTKLLLSITVLVMLVLAGLIFTYEQITRSVANRYLGEYDTQIDHLEVSPKSLNHWHFNKLAFTVSDTVITLNQVDIKLKPGFVSEKITPSLIEQVSLGSIDVQLGHRFLADDHKTPDEQGPAVALDLRQLPLINIGKVDLTIQGLPSDDFSLAIDHLKLDPSRNLKSKIILNNRDFITVAAQFGDKTWQLETELDLNTIQKIHSQNFRLPDSDVTLTPIFDLLAKLQQSYQVQGQLHSTFELGLKTGQFKSQHQWRNPSLLLRDYADLALVPLNPANHEPRFLVTFGGHLADLNIEVAPFTLTLKPDQRQQQALLTALFNNMELESKVGDFLHGIIKQPELSLILEKPTTFALSTQHLEVPQVHLSLKEQQKSSDTPPNQVAVEFNKFSYILPKNSPESLTKISSDWQFNGQLTQLPALQKIWPAIFGTNKMSFATASVQSSGTLAVIHSDTSKAADAVSKSGNSTAKKIETSTENDLDISVTLDKDSVVRLSNVAMEAPSNIDTQLEPLEPSLQKQRSEAIKPSLQLLSIDAMAYELLATTEYQYTQIQLDAHHALKLPPMMLSAANIQGISAQPALHVGKKSTINNAKIKLNEPVSFEFSQSLATAKLESTAIKEQQAGKNHKTFIEQFFYHQWRNQLQIDLSGLTFHQYILPSKLQQQPTELQGSHLSVSLVSQWLKQHKLDANHQLDRLNLTQTFEWDKQRWQSREDWQLSDINLVSEHQWLRQQKMHNKQALSDQPWQLQGKLALQTDLADLQNLLVQNIQLKDALYLNGFATLNGNYQVNSKDNHQQISFNFKPELTDLEGSIELLPFKDVDFSSQCQGFWQDTPSKRNGPLQSQLSCQDIEFDIMAFNPGILISNAKVEGKILLQQDFEELAKSSTTRSLIQGDYEGQDAHIELQATGDLLNGQLLIPVFNLSLHDKSSTYMVLQGLDLHELMQIQPQVGIYADGVFDGVLPTEIQHGKLSIAGGTLVARSPGGLIQIQGNPAVEQMRASQPHLDFAFATLEHLEYSKLSSSFDMTQAGDARLAVHVEGTSPNVERPIQFNYSHEENMLQLLKSLQIGDKLQQQIEQSIQ